VRIELVDGPYLALDGAGRRGTVTHQRNDDWAADPAGFAPTGGAVAFETAEFSHFDGGLLARHAVVLDMLGLARQIGAVPQQVVWPSASASGSAHRRSPGTKTVGRRRAVG